MSKLVKATLQKIFADEDERPDGSPFPVQFNPSSLRLRVTNQIEGGRSTAKQVRQQTGNSSRTLTLELFFDTADEGSTGSPVSVRDKTKKLEDFISTPEKNPDPPPKLKFVWGDMILVGIADSIDINLEHFAPNGYPLRAKVNLSIKEQDPRIQFQPGNRDSSSAKSPGGKLGSPGAGTNLGFSAGISAGLSLGLSAGIGINASIGGSAGVKVGLALEGETSAEFAARVGADPNAWRSLQSAQGSGIGLSAGELVGFNSAINSSPGVGVSGGVNTKGGVANQAASGLNLATIDKASFLASSSINQQSDPDEAGKAMSSLGGVDASINAIKIQQSAQQTHDSISAFGMGFSDMVSHLGDSTSVRNSLFNNRIVNQPITRTPLIHSGSNSFSQVQSAPSQPAPPRVDVRAVSFGQGIPLQALLGVAQAQQQAKVYGNRQQVTGIDQHLAPISNDKSIAPWVALPSRDPIRQSTNELELTKQGGHCQATACDCHGTSS